MEMDQLNPGQIKKYLKQIKQREQEYLYYLGQLAYQAGETGQLEDAGMLEAYQTLKDLQVQAAQCEASLEQIRASKEAAQNPRCPSCGGPIVRNAVFCPNCGVSVAASPKMAAPAAATVAAAPALSGPACMACGAPLDADAVFCGNCGARMEAAPEPGAVAPVSSPAEVPATDAPEVSAPSEETAPPLEETWACPSCGTGLAEKDMLFCPKCGTKVKE